MKWKVKLLVGILCVGACIGSYKVGTYIGVIAGYTYGAQMGSAAQDAKIKSFCDGDHRIWWGEQQYYCTPGGKS